MATCISPRCTRPAEAVFTNDDGPHAACFICLSTLLLRLGVIPAADALMDAAACDLAHLEAQELTWERLGSFERPDPTVLAAARDLYQGLLVNASEVA